MTEGTKIIDNGFVVTCDSQHRVGSYSILVKGDRIIEIGNRGEVLKSLNPTAEIIDAKGKIVLPGFIDSHYHGESFVLRHFTSMKPMNRWSRESEIQSAFRFIHKHADPQELSVVYRLAYFNALKSGVTTLAEFGFDNLDQPLHSAFEAMRRSDLRGLIGLHNGDQIERARSIRHPSVRFAIVLSDEEDLTTYNLQAAVRAAADLKIPLLVHAGETKRGAERIKRNFQRTLMKLLHEHRLLENTTLLLHAACLDSGDLDILARSAARIILAPRSAVVKGTEHPPILEFVSRGIPTVLASDWGSTDLFEVIRSYIILAQDQGAELPSATSLLSMVTSDAAKSLRIHDSVGAIEAGKKADMTFVDFPDIRLSSMTNRNPDSLLSSFLMEATAHDVTDVMINGEFFVRQRQVLTYSEEDLIREGEGLMARLLQPAAGMAKPTLAASPPSTDNLTTSVSGSDVTAGFEEGFRIVQKDGVPRKAPKIIPLPIEHPKKTDTPSKVKKVFGDEDI